MPQRECSYKASQGVKSAIPESTIEEIVKRVVDEAYDNNMFLNKKTYAKRFQLWTVRGKPANGGELLDALHNRPDEVGYLLPIVYLWEDGGNDNIVVFLHTEVLKLTGLDPDMLKMAKQPPNITLEDMLRMHSEWRAK